ncbi:DUF6517 family protein [Natronorubrum sp. FCH18a]|uniref:DUF6517 family protein n=1 Tax=Natronorubrum sp. FCH18a TaxID=3447018 RepID=UPI003F517C4F
MKRRTVLGGLGAAGLASLSGCLGLVGMDEHESSPVGVAASVRDETGYAQTAIDDIVVEEEVGVSAATETISVTNYLTEHEKEVSIGPLVSQRAAVFIALTTPQIGIAGRNVNPVEDMTTEELIELVEENYDDISNISREEDDEITVLGSETTRSRFDADATFDGHEFTVDVHVSEAVETEDDDLLVTIGVYPQELRGQEEENVLALMNGMTADIDTNDDGDDEGTGDESDENENDESGDDGNDSENGDDDGDEDDDGGVLGTLE